MSISIGWSGPEEADGSNRCCPHHPLTELGDIELAVPRKRRFPPSAVVRASTRRLEQSQPAKVFSPGSWAR
jgi:hypothetical protein